MIDICNEGESVDMIRGTKKNLESVDAGKGKTEKQLTRSLISINEN